MRNRIALCATVVATGMLLAGCQEELPSGKPATPSSTTTSAQAPATPNADGVLNPGDTGKLESGVELSILKVEADEVEREGTVSVFTFQLNNTGKTTLDNWSRPTLVYGADGTAAEYVLSLDKKYQYGMEGKLPPGSKQTIKIAYAVPVDKLNPAVITSEELIWRGDFSKYNKG
ncbi:MULTISPECIES: hypothetical protein [Nocardia]|uniref:DUF4352 domain-containing protein n=1 Tax=Nocardia coubleae TaxID=356147 RepID=A0A846WD87_9NOCA|nr:MULTISPECIES: hypothetical protein [Nocardia]NKX90594.1 hypothetical protein [Nocardia coubleae]